MKIRLLSFFAMLSCVLAIANPLKCTIFESDQDSSNVDFSPAHWQNPMQPIAENTTLAHAMIDADGVLGGIRRTASSSNEIYINPKYQGDSLQKIRLARRFLDSEHFTWEATKMFRDKNEFNLSLPQRVESLTHFYGKGAFEGFQEAVSFVEKNASNRLPSIEDFQRINLLALGKQRSKFEGYYRNARKYPEKFPNGKKEFWEKDRGQIVELGTQGKSDLLFQNYGIADPLGQIRDFGDLIFSSPSPYYSLEGRQLHFSPKQMEAYRKNPFLRILNEEQSPGGFIKAKMSYAPGELVPQYLATAFNETHAKCTALKKKKGGMKPEEYARAVDEVAAKFYHDLVSIHPFWDGVGRSSKLARDWIYQHMGVEHPAFTPTFDLDMSPAELAQIFAHARMETRAGLTTQ